MFSSDFQLHHQFKDLSLDADVERRGGLVGEKQGRTAGKRHGDHDPLPHAPGELIRVFADPAFRRGHTHLGEHLNGTLQGFGPREVAVGSERLPSVGCPP